MLVCLCNGLNESAVREAARGCSSSRVQDVYASIGCAIDCGCCAGFAKSVIEEARQGAHPALLAAE